MTDKDKRIADMDVSCHDCGCRWDAELHWELNSYPRVYSALGCIKRVCDHCYRHNGQSLEKRRRTAGLPETPG